MKIKTNLMVATAAIALLAAAAPAVAQLTTTTTKTTKTSVGPLSATTDTIISAETTADKVVKETVTKVKETDTGATVSTTTTTQTTPVTTRSEVKVNTTETALAASGTRLFNTAEFDINNDGVLSTAEVGEKLFAMYDFDGNGMIDNLEYERNAVVTVVPVEKNTTITYDFNGDGIAEQQEKVYENFLRYTQLSRFDGDLDGLSPREFVARGYLEADIDGDKLISKKEWQGSYNAEIDRSNKIQGNLNK
jgi:hypothetical protein